MNILAIYSMKGGVGKTAAAVNLAYEAAAADEQVLLWDLDPQGAASWYLGLSPDDALDARKIVAGKVPLGRHVRHTEYPRLHALPGDFSYRHWDAYFLDAKGTKKALGKLIEPFSERYSLMILDCPPGIGALATAVLRAADRILVPVVPTPLSLRALGDVRELRADDKKKSGRITPFYSLVDRRRRIHRDLIANPPKTMKGLLRTWIDYSADIERMGEYRAPVAEYAPRSRATRQFRDLWQELGSALRI